MKPRYKIRFVTKETKNKQESEKKTKARRIWVKAEFELWKVVF